MHYDTKTGSVKGKSSCFTERKGNQVASQIFMNGGIGSAVVSGVNRNKIRTEIGISLRRALCLLL